jgi:hypothetical protein
LKNVPDGEHVVLRPSVLTDQPAQVAEALAAAVRPERLLAEETGRRRRFVAGGASEG